MAKSNATNYEYKGNNQAVLSEDRKNELIDNVNKMVSKKETIALHKILGIAKTEDEYQFLFEYLEDNKVLIRGINSSLAGEIPNYEHLPKDGQSYLPPMLSEDESTRLFEMKATGNEEEKASARDELITHNMRLVNWIVGTRSEFQYSEFPKEDLISFGYEALIRAVDNFDYTRGYKFSTYAVEKIYWEIRNQIVRQARIVHIPAHIAEKIGEVERAKSIIIEEKEKQGLKPEVTADEIAKIIDMPLRTAEQVFYAINMRELESIDAMLEDSWDVELDKKMGDEDITLAGGFDITGNNSKAYGRNNAPTKENVDIIEEGVLLDQEEPEEFGIGYTLMDDLNATHDIYHHTVTGATVHEDLNYSKKRERTQIVTSADIINYSVSTVDILKKIYAILNEENGSKKLLVFLNRAMKKINEEKPWSFIEEHRYTLCERIYQYLYNLENASSEVENYVEIKDLNISGIENYLKSKAQQISEYVMFKVDNGHEPLEVIESEKAVAQSIQEFRNCSLPKEIRSRLEQEVEKIFMQKYEETLKKTGKVFKKMALITANSLVIEYLNEKYDFRYMVCQAIIESSKINEEQAVILYDIFSKIDELKNLTIGKEENQQYEEQNTRESSATQLNFEGQTIIQSSDEVDSGEDSKIQSNEEVTAGVGQTNQSNEETHVEMEMTVQSNDEMSVEEGENVQFKEADVEQIDNDRENENTDEVPEDLNQMLENIIKELSMLYAEKTKMLQELELKEKALQKRIQEIKSEINMSEARIDRLTKIIGENAEFLSELGELEPLERKLLAEQDAIEKKRNEERQLSQELSEIDAEKQIVEKEKQDIKSKVKDVTKDI